MQVGVPDGWVLGGNVRVGLEESLWAAPIRLATSSADQVRIHVCKILEGLSRDIATPDEAREMLQLKGSHAVGL